MELGGNFDVDKHIGAPCWTPIDCATLGVNCRLTRLVAWLENLICECVLGGSLHPRCLCSVEICVLIVADNRAQDRNPPFYKCPQAAFDII